MRVSGLPLSLVLCAGVVVAMPGCDLLLEAVCDPEADENCEDITRAQITGVITIPEAGGASTTKRLMGPEFGGLRAAVAKAAREQKGERDVDVKKRSRVPVVGHGNDHEVVKYPVEKFRPGEVVVRGHESIRGRKAEISRALSYELNDDVNVNVRLCGTEFRCLADLTDRHGKKET